MFPVTVSAVEFMTEMPVGGVEEFHWDVPSPVSGASG